MKKYRSVVLIIAAITSIQLAIAGGEGGGWGSGGKGGDSYEADFKSVGYELVQLIKANPGDFFSSTEIQQIEDFLKKAELDVRDDLDWPLIPDIWKLRFKVLTKAIVGIGRSTTSGEKAVESFLQSLSSKVNCRQVLRDLSVSIERSRSLFRRKIVSAQIHNSFIYHQSKRFVRCSKDFESESRDSQKSCLSSPVGARAYRRFPMETTVFKKAGSGEVRKFYEALLAIYNDLIGADEGGALEPFLKKLKLTTLKDITGKCESCIKKNVEIHYNDLNRSRFTVEVYKETDSLRFNFMNYFAQTIESLSVEIQEGKIVLNGRVRQGASRAQERLLKLDRDVLSNAIQLAQLRKFVAHEALLLMGIDDSDYAVSSALSLLMSDFSCGRKFTFLELSALFAYTEMWNSWGKEGSTPPKTDYMKTVDRIGKVMKVCTNLCPSFNEELDFRRIDNGGTPDGLDGGFFKKAKTMNLEELEKSLEEVLVMRRSLSGTKVKDRNTSGKQPPGDRRL